MLSLNGTSIRVVTFLDNAYIYDVEIVKSGEGESTEYQLVGGYAVSLLHELSQLLNFRIELVWMEPNVVYNFPVAIHNYSIDFFASSFFLSADESRFADPTFVTERSRIKAFFNRAFEGSMQDVVAAPFKPSVWLLLAFSMPLMSTAFCFLAYHVEGVGYYSSLFQMISVFLLRDSAVHVHSSSSRTVQLAGSITVYLLMSAYSAKIASISAISVESVSTLAGLVASIFDISYDVGYGNASTMEFNVQIGSKDPTLLAINAKAAQSKFRFDTFESAMIEVQSRPFAYIIDEETAYSSARTVSGRLPCELGIRSVHYGELQWSMYTRKGFEHRKAINSGLLRLKEIGAMWKFARHYIPGRGADSSACSTGAFAEFSGVYFTQIKIAFIIFAGGTLCACLFLLVETSRWKLVARSSTNCEGALDSLQSLDQNDVNCN